MKKLLLLALGFSLAAQNVNANLLTEDQARNARKAAAAVYVGTTAFKAANVDLGVDVNERVNDAQKYSKQLYAVLASALEEGDFVVKFANVANSVDISGFNDQVATWYHATEKDAKKRASADLKKFSKEQAPVLIAATAVELGEILADKLVNSKINNKYARRAIRAATYAATYALTTSLTAMTLIKLTAPTETAQTKKDKQADKPGLLAIGRDLFVDEFVKTFIQNLVYEAAGEAAAELLIEKSLAVEAAA